MARIHGQRGRLYVGLASGTAAAEPVAFLNSWKLDFNTSRATVTCFGDANEVYAAGLPDCQGTYAGWYDTATTQLYAASQDGVARKTYLYPDITTSPNQYWFGTALFDFGVEGGVSAGVAINGSFAAASSFAKVG